MFYQFNEIKRTFEHKYTSLYDITEGINEITTSGWTNEFLLPHNYNTYFFRKEKVHDKFRLQLYRVSMDKPNNVFGKPEIDESNREQVKMTKYKIDLDMEKEQKYHEKKMAEFEEENK